MSAFSGALVLADFSWPGTLALGLSTGKKTGGSRAHRTSRPLLCRRGRGGITPSAHLKGHIMQGAHPLRIRLAARHRSGRRACARTSRVLTREHQRAGHRQQRQCMGQDTRWVHSTVFAGRSMTRSGLQAMHCDVGSWCSSHQSLVALKPAISVGLQRVH